MFTLTGTLTDHSAQPLVGTEVLILPVPHVMVDGDGDVIRTGGATVTTDERGSFSVDLVSAPGLVYRVRSTTGGPVPLMHVESQADGTTHDLADVGTLVGPLPPAPARPVHFAADRGVLIFTTGA